MNFGVELAGQSDRIFLGGFRTFAEVGGKQDLLDGYHGSLLRSRDSRAGVPGHHSGHWQSAAGRVDDLQQESRSDASERSSSARQMETDPGAAIASRTLFPKMPTTLIDTSRLTSTSSFSLRDSTSMTCTPLLKL